MIGVAFDSSIEARTVVAIEPRYRELLDAGDRHAETAGALTLLEGRCNGQQLRAAISDRAVAGGSFGVDESEALAAHLRRSLHDRIPFALILDSGGARLDAGLAGLGAFRRLYRIALEVRLSKVPMVAFVERDCFGGASMLAMLCHVRSAIENARLGMSGPGIVATFTDGRALDASDREAVQALYGARARAHSGAIDTLVAAETPRRDALVQLLEHGLRPQAGIRAQHESLEKRLRVSGVSTKPMPLPEAAALFHSGNAVGAAELWQLSNAMLSCQRGQTVELRIDCPGQAATRLDEELVLSEYVVHLALCLRESCHRGVEVVMRIDGESAGGIYVAFAAGAQRIEATPDANVRVLPEKAIKVVLGKSMPDETLEAGLCAGITDRLVPASRQ